ncbi:glioma pathogenesis-related protein 1b [Megalops cyprinoides]|uniref:glioma pathogenesis-related protein 1b n=1 Tax=Megalops cyprinoides TaxID=118141 RepID=UPI00186422B4|nr:glioma pathogenesis-related protein 1b [Megalops cyprinoides]
MALRLPLILWLTVLMDSIILMQSAQEKQLPDITDQSFIDRCVKAHNDHRSRVNPAASDMLYMTWDEALAKSARAWARNCKNFHNPLLQTRGKVHPTFSPVGENIWVGEPFSTFTVEGAVQKWFNEVAEYTYSTKECKSVCGHYKQVVWAKSYKVGCAVQVCPNGIEEFSNNPKSAIFVCNYGDAGNIKGHHPYKEGTSCSGCPSDSCNNKLCRNPKREELKSYSWSPDWDPGAASSASCNSFCLAVVITRPLSLLLIFAGVYGLQLLYPNLFAYE